MVYIGFWVICQLSIILLCSPFFAALIKSNDLKCYKYEKVLEAIINEHIILEKSRIYNGAKHI